MATLMVLMFEEYADIPSKLYLFYEQAFETLFYRHDATKNYLRPRHTSLSIDQFRALFAAISAISYSQQRLSFSEAELVEVVRMGCQVSGIQVDVRNFLRDLHESVCVLQLDGTKYQFTHKTFQEYFAACFALAREDSEARRFFDSVSHRATTDRVLRLAFDIDQARFERVWALPTLRSLCARFRVLKNQTFSDALKKLRADVVVVATHVDQRAKFAVEINASAPFEELGVISLLESLYGGTLSVGTLSYGNLGDRWLDGERTNLQRYRGFGAWENSLVSLNQGQTSTFEIRRRDSDERGWYDWLLPYCQEMLDNTIGPLLSLQQKVEDRVASRSAGFLEIFPPPH